MREDYTLEEAMDLFEIVAVARYNEHLAAKHAERKK